MKETRNSREKGDRENPQKGGTGVTRRTEADYGGKDGGGGKAEERKRDRGITRTGERRRMKSGGGRERERERYNIDRISTAADSIYPLC